MSMCVTQCPAGDAMAMCAIVRLRSCFDLTDVQLYNRVSCKDYIARFKEFRNKTIQYQRTVCIAERIKRNRIVNSGLRRLPSHPEM